MNYTTSDRSAVSPDGGRTAYPLTHPVVTDFLNSGGKIGAPLIELQDDSDYVRAAERADLINEAYDLVMSKLGASQSSEPDAIPLPPNPIEAKLSDYGNVGPAPPSGAGEQGEGGEGVPAEIRELMEDGETMSQARRRLTEVLNAEPPPPSPPEPPPAVTLISAEAHNALIQELREKLEALQKENAALKTKPLPYPDEGEARSLPPEGELPERNSTLKLSEVGPVGAVDPILTPAEADQEVSRILDNLHEGFDVGDEISGLSAPRREDLTAALHRRKAKMRRERMTGASPDVEGEAAIDQLVGLLARRGV